MPINPININRSAKVESTKIEPGSIVEYEHHNKAFLAVAISENKGNWLLLNEKGDELRIISSRLYLFPGRIPPTVSDVKSKVAFLLELNNKVSELIKSTDIEELWNVLAEDRREYSVKYLSELLYNDNSLLHHIASRRLLLNNNIYFKRQKNGFEPRPANIIAELLVQVEAEEQKRAIRQELVESLLMLIQGRQVELPANIYLIEELAALGSKAPSAKEGLIILEEVINQAKIDLSGKIEDKAFELLVKIKHFSQDQNLSFLRLNRPIRFSQDVVEIAQTVSDKYFEQLHPLTTNFLSSTIFTIDSEDTCDIDDAISFEKTQSGFQLGIHIANVSFAIEKDSVLDKEILARGTSIYCSDSQVPMLPRILSEHTFSLKQAEPRAVMSFIFELNNDLQITKRDIKLGSIKVTHRLSYNQVDAWLYESPQNCQLTLIPELHTLWELVGKLETNRLGKGATQFPRREMFAKLLTNGKISLETNSDDTPARKLISELMILANETAAIFAKQQGFPLIYRGQEPPETNLDKLQTDLPEGPAKEYFIRSFLKRSITTTDPIPHYSLGTTAYTQITSPIRRAADLINQRQISYILQKQTLCYTATELSELLLLIESKIDEAQQIQKERNRYWLLKYVQQEHIKEFNAVVVRNDGNKPLAEIDKLFILATFTPINKKQLGANHQKGNELKPGDQIRLQIDKIDPRKDIFNLSQINS